MIGFWRRVVEAIERAGRIARVSVVATRGSTPREVGADLLLLPDGGFHGTIGGGAFEAQAIEAATAALAEGAASVTIRDFLLGPDLGQCCGGRVTIAVEVMDRGSLAEARRLAAREAEGPFAVEARIVDGRMRREIIDALDSAPPAVGLAGDGVVFEHFGDDRRALLLFGAGHVGRALVLALAPLPFRVTWVDGRPGAFPAVAPGNVTMVAETRPEMVVAAAAPGSFVLAMTHDHGLDLAVMDAASRRDDLPWVGTIGSQTKRARFNSRLLEMGHTAAKLRRMVCPVGAQGPRSKAPAAIAAAVAVELLIADEAARNSLVQPDRVIGERRKAGE